MVFVIQVFIFDIFCKPGLFTLLLIRHMLLGDFFVFVIPYFTSFLSLLPSKFNTNGACETLNSLLLTSLPDQTNLYVFHPDNWLCYRLRFFCFFIFVCSDTCDSNSYHLSIFLLKNRFGIFTTFFCVATFMFWSQNFSKLTVFSVPSNLHAKIFIRYTNRTFQLIQ